MKLLYATTLLLASIGSGSSLATSNVAGLIAELKQIASSTARGFRASPSERAQVKVIVDELSKVSACLEPAAAYYEKGASRATEPTYDGDEPSLLGRWKLIYSDAPDIVGLEAQGGPFAELGRIGQECDGEESTIANVISWAPSKFLREGGALGLLGQTLSSDELEQRVVLKAKASPTEPRRVQLFVEGFDLDPLRVLGRQGGLGGGGPLRLRGPLSGRVPFGAFDVMYLDEDLRVVKTVGTGYLAINVRDPLLPSDK